MKSRFPVVLLVAAVVLASCTEEKAAAPAAAPAPAPAPAAAPAPAKAVADTASVASVSGKSDPECVGPLATGVAEKLTVAGKDLELNGYRLKLLAADADDTAVIGVIANANEASPENLANLEAIAKFFAENGVELVVVAGDSGDDRANIEAVLRKIAGTGLPTVAISGNREPKAAFVDAVNAVRKEFPHLVNGNRVRRIDWDDVDLVTLPGYHDPRYIHAAEAGCQYFREDVDSLATLAAEANHPVLLVAHGAPKGDTPDGLDAIAGEKPEERRNVGDPNLRAVLASAKIPFGIFPNIKEAGGRAFADVGGNKAVPQGQPAEQLYLNPGSADSLPWTMNDGTTARGMAAVVTVKGNRASYRLFQAPATVGPAKGETAANQ
jgi:Icc-related predicted phosphoesterase